MFIANFANFINGKALQHLEIVLRNSMELHNLISLFISNHCEHDLLHCMFFFSLFSIIQQTESSAAAATQAASSPSPPPSNCILVNPKIDRIANDITALNLVEVAELSELLKKRLNLPDAPIASVAGFALPSQSVVTTSL